MADEYTRTDEYTRADEYTQTNEREVALLYQEMAISEKDARLLQQIGLMAHPRVDGSTLV